MENQIKELKKLKHFLNEMTGKKASICETFYSDVDFRMAQPIKIDTKGSALPKHSTVTLQGIICTPARISSTNTIRKYSFRGKYMFVVRIFTNVFFRLKTIHVTTCFKISELLRTNYGKLLMHSLINVKYIRFRI